MALPWFKDNKKAQGGSTTEWREPDKSKLDEQNPDDIALEAGAQDLLKAIQMDDKKLTLKAFKALFELMDGQPHNEGPHTNEENSEE